MDQDANWKRTMASLMSVFRPVQTALQVPWGAHSNPPDAKAKDAHLFGVDLWRMP